MVFFHSTLECLGSAAVLRGRHREKRKQKEVKMNMNEALSQFGHDMGLGYIRLDHNNRCSILIDEKYIVTIEVDSIHEQTNLYGIVAKGPFDDRISLFGWLLESNFQGELTGRAFLSLDKENDQVLLCQRVDHNEISYQQFVNLLERYVNYYERVLEQVDSIPSGLTPQASMQYGSMPVGMIKA